MHYKIIKYCNCIELQLKLDKCILCTNVDYMFDSNVYGYKEIGFVNFALAGPNFNFLFLSRLLETAAGCLPLGYNNTKC